MAESLWQAFLQWAKLLHIKSLSQAMKCLNVRRLCVYTVYYTVLDFALSACSTTDKRNTPITFHWYLHFDMLI